MISAIILAAGKGERFGELKQLYKIDGVPILQMVINRITPFFNELVLVLGHEADKIVSSIKFSQNIKIVVNPSYESGMGSSLSCGIEHLSEDCSHFAIFLSDMPYIKKESIGLLINQLNENKKEIVAPSYRGKRGFPVIFSRHFIDELKGLSGDRGARDLILKEKKHLRLLEVSDIGVVRDVDTKKDL